MKSMLLATVIIGGAIAGMILYIQSRNSSGSMQNLPGSKQKTGLANRTDGNLLGTPQSVMG